MPNNEKETLVLVHGSPADGRAWAGVEEALGGKFNVLTPTLIGHGAGGNGEPVPPIETTDLANGIEAGLPKFDKPVYLAGHSYGANVALHLALKGTLPVKRLVLLEPVAFEVLPLVGEPSTHKTALDALQGYLSAAANNEPEAISKMIDLWFGPGAYPKFPEFLRDYLCANTDVNLRDVQASLREEYNLEALAALSAPTLIGFGTKSPAVLESIARSVAGTLANGQAHSIDGADHAMLAACPEVVADFIETFVGAES